LYIQEEVFKYYHGRILLIPYSHGFFVWVFDKKRCEINTFYFLDEMKRKCFLCVVFSRYITFHTQDQKLLMFKLYLIEVQLIKEKFRFFRNFVRSFLLVRLRRRRRHLCIQLVDFLLLQILKDILPFVLSLNQFQI